MQIVPFRGARSNGEPPAGGAGPVELLAGDIVELAHGLGPGVSLYALQIRGWTPGLIEAHGVEACAIAAEALGFEPSIDAGGRSGGCRLLCTLPNGWRLVERSRTGFAWVLATEGDAWSRPPFA